GGQVAVAVAGPITVTASGAAARSQAIAASQASRSSGRTSAWPLTPAASSGGDGHRAARTIIVRPRSCEAPGGAGGRAVGLDRGDHVQGLAGRPGVVSAADPGAQPGAQ